jgi:hypothetical protein
MPQALGAVIGATLTINDNAGDTPQVIPLTGTGVQGKLTVTPGSLKFTKVPLQTTSAAKLVTLKNKTGSTFTIASITNGNAAFVADTSGCPGNVVPANASCQVSVTYAPGSNTAKVTDSLVVTADDLKSPHNVNLSGTGQ